MDNLSFKITQGRKKYHVYIERELCHYFNTKNEAREYIKRYRHAVHDNVIMLNNVHSQICNIRQVFYPHFNFDTKHKMRDLFEQWEDAYYSIYHNMGGENKATVQFNKIKLSFVIVDDILIELRAFAGTSNLPALRTQLKAITKIFNLVWESYNNDIRYLFVSSGKDAKVRTLQKRTNEANNNLSNRAKLKKLPTTN